MKKCLKNILLARIMIKKEWSNYNPVHIDFGRSQRRNLVDALKGKNCLVVTTKRGRSQILNDKFLCKLEKSSKLTWIDTVQSNPNLFILKKIF